MVTVGVKTVFLIQPRCWIQTSVTSVSNASPNASGNDVCTDIIAVVCSDGGLRVPVGTDNAFTARQSWTKRLRIKARARTTLTPTRAQSTKPHRLCDDARFVVFRLCASAGVGI